MRRLLGPLFLLAVVAAYGHLVLGWDPTQMHRNPAVARFFPPDASATDTPIGQRGTGTHWESASPMPDARTEFGAAAVGDVIYVVGGIDGYARTLSSALAYDIAADAWREIPRLPQAVHHPAVVSDGTKLYAIGGLTGLASRPIDDVYAFDPAKNAWEALGRLNDFRGAAGAAVLDGTPYVMGGVTPAGTDGSLERYDAARGTWTGLAALPTPRTHLSSVAADRRLYALGGRAGSASKSLDAAEAYDPAKETWTALAPMPSARSAASAASVGGTLYAIGGVAKDGLVPSVDAYGIASGTWTATSTPPLPHPRHGLAAVAWKDRIYVLGGGLRAGFSVSALNDVLILAE